MNNELTFDNITFDELDTLLRFLSAKTKIPNIDINDVVNYIKTQENTKYYFDQTISGSDEKNSMYLWLDTGFLDERKHPLFISCLNHQGSFIGHIVGDANLLTQSMAAFNKIREQSRREKLGRFLVKYERKIENRSVKCLNEKYKEKSIEQNTTKDNSRRYDRSPSEELVKRYWSDDNVSDLTKDVARLLIINKWHSIQGLDKYIKVIGARLAQLVKADKTQYFVLNNIKSAICNTGLLNTFGDDIYILYRMNLSYGFYSPYKIILEKNQYEAEGFTMEQSMIKLDPISFFDDEAQRFNVDIDQINFNPHDWLHIIEDRRGRFPAELRQVSDVALIAQIRQSLDIGLKFQKRDRSFAKPIYSATTGTVSWVLPFFLNGDFTSTPELVMVISKCGSFYQLKTILPYDDEVKDKLMRMSIYSRMW